MWHDASFGLRIGSLKGVTYMVSAPGCHPKLFVLSSLGGKREREMLNVHDDYLCQHQKPNSVPIVLLGKPAQHAKVDLTKNRH